MNYNIVYRVQSIKVDVVDGSYYKYSKGIYYGNLIDYLKDRRNSCFLVI